MSRFAGHEAGPASDPESIRRGAPWLSAERARHWAAVISDAVEAGAYTARRQWEISDEILRER